MNLTDKMNEHFNDKFSFLKLFDVVYDKGLNVCTFTFLYPYDVADPSDEERDLLVGYLREFFALNAKIRLKLKKSFLDPPLVKKEIKNYFESDHKGLCPYINMESVICENVNRSVDIKIFLNKDVLSMLDETVLQSGLKSFLEKRFIADFNIALQENEEMLPTEIEVEDIYIPRQRLARYDVNVVKKIIGKDIAPKPEYIKNVTKPKSSVIFAGIVSNMTKKTFIIKKGKHQGEEKSLYSFVLKDDTPVDCIYFCAKSHEKDMNAIQDGMMLLCVGDMQKGLSGRLTYYIKKISLASACEKPAEPETILPIDARVPRKRVVFPEPLPITAQSNLFEEKAKYNEFILNNDIVVFDLETTGLDPETCEITELGAVKIVRGEIREKFSTFVKPKGSIPEIVTKLTGITDEMVAHAPSIENVIQDFYDYTRGCIISGYNVVGFDMKFIKKAAASIGLKFDNDVIDAMIIVRQSPLRVGNYKLGTVVKALGLTLNDAHRAYNDALATGQVLLEMNKNKKKEA